MPQRSSSDGAIAAVAPTAKKLRAGKVIAPSYGPGHFDLGTSRGAGGIYPGNWLTDVDFERSMVGALDLDLRARDDCGGGGDVNGDENSGAGLDAEFGADLGGDEGDTDETLSGGNMVDENGRGASGKLRFVKGLRTLGGNHKTAAEAK